MWVMWEDDSGQGWHVGFLEMTNDHDGPYHERHSVYRFRSMGDAADKVHYLNGGNKV